MTLLPTSLNNLMDTVLVSRIEIIMTKKDYELIASALKEELTYAQNLRQGKLDVGMQDVSYFTAQVNGVKGCIGTMCSTLYLHNSKFDTNKFLQACGIEVKQAVYVNNKGKTVYTKD